MLNGALKIYIPDTTYGSDNGDVDCDSKSRELQQELEAEFHLPFQKTNIGPSIDVPAFVTNLSLTAWPYIGAAILLFFQGKRISENLESWAVIYRRLSSFFHRSPRFERDSAAVLALEAITSELGNAPESIRLVGYGFRSVFDAHEACCELKINDGPPSIFLAMAVHVFLVEADGQAFKITVDGHIVKLTSEGDAG